MFIPTHAHNVSLFVFFPLATLAPTFYQTAQCHNPNGQNAVSYFYLLGFFVTLKYDFLTSMRFPLQFYLSPCRQPLPSWPCPKRNCRHFFLGRPAIRGWFPARPVKKSAVRMFPVVYRQSVTLLHKQRATPT